MKMPIKRKSVANANKNETKQNYLRSQGITISKLSTNFEDTNQEGLIVTESKRRVRESVGGHPLTVDPSSES